MRISLTQPQLAGAIQTVARAVSGKTTAPVLTGILISAENSRITLKAYDTEIGIQAPAGGTVERDGSIVLPAKIMGEIIRSIPQGNITIDADVSNHTATLTWGRSEFTIHGFDAVQFPSLPEISAAGPITVETETMKGMIRQTAFATAQSDARPVLTGVLLEASGRELSMVAIDGVRLSFRRVYLSNDGIPESKAIVPARALNEVARLIQSGPEVPSVGLEAGQGHALFTIGEVRVISRLLEGQFPPYQQIIPKSYSTTVTIRRQDLHDACERASLVSSDDDNTIRLNISGGCVSMSAASPEVGRVREDVDAQVEGESLEIAFNARLLIEGLRVIDVDEVLLRSTGKFSPACIRYVDHENFIYVVMPLRTAEVS
ncbi:MAG: DNA polymerase III subunit beta [Firmicutes bacterium]|nr:DNA polymerase III subunit beta [Bacillota bacterium]